MAIAVDDIKEGAIIRWLRGHHPGSLCEIVQANVNTIYLRNVTPGSSSWGSGSDKGKRWAVGRWRLQVQCELVSPAPSEDERRARISAAVAETETALSRIAASVGSSAPPVAVLERPEAPGYQLTPTLERAFREHCDSDRERFRALWLDAGTSWRELTQLLELSVGDIMQLAQVLGIDEPRPYVPSEELAVVTAEPDVADCPRHPDYELALDLDTSTNRWKENGQHFSKRHGGRVRAELERRGGAGYLRNLYRWVGLMRTSVLLNIAPGTLREIGIEMGVQPPGRGARPLGLQRGYVIVPLPNSTLLTNADFSAYKQAVRAGTPQHKEATVATFKTEPAKNGANAPTTIAQTAERVGVGAYQPGATMKRWAEEMARDRANLKVREDELREQLAQVVLEREAIDGVLETLRKGTPA